MNPLTGNDLSIIIPGYNNLLHLKNAYASIKKHAPEVELILLDDGSTDGTWEWLQGLPQQDKHIQIQRSEKRVGHTILYDVGIDMATRPVVGIFHADMVMGPNYVANILKHLQKGAVVCGTRVEPPLHPEGKEKLIRNFGMDFDDLDIDSFEKFTEKAQQEYKDQVTSGMFAPWVLFKEDFTRMGGHDPIFAPFPYEDSDIFQRWILAGYKLLQSRDAFVYHLTCRGHRWTEQIGKDDNYYQTAQDKAARNYIRKWGSWIANNEYQYPIIKPKYDIGIEVVGCNSELLELLEPWCSTILIDDEMQVLTSHYLDKEQKNTSFNLKDKIKTTPFDVLENEIRVEIDRKTFGGEDFRILQQLPDIIKDSGEPGRYQIGNMVLEIVQMNEYQNNLITL